VAREWPILKIDQDCDKFVKTFNCPRHVIYDQECNSDDIQTNKKACASVLIFTA